MGGLRWGLVVTTAVAAAAAAAPSAWAGVVAYPSSETIFATGPLPPESSSRISLNAAVGEHEGALLVVTGAPRVAVSLDRNRLGPLTLRLSFAHFVSFGRRLVPDALIPWSGASRRTEQPNQPVLAQVEVPYGTAPGRYTARLRVTAGRRTTTVPLSVHVFALALPRPGTRGTLLTSFHVSPGTYVFTARRLFELGSKERQIAANDALYSLFARERISPASWGFGEPRTAAGYASSSRWWLSSLDDMAREVAAGPFSTLRIPISSNRTGRRNYIGGLSPFAPESWCAYLQAVHSTWQARGWLAGGALPYLYAFDEPDLVDKRLVARQAESAHRCFPGAEALATTNPDPGGRDRFLWDGGSDDVDIWAILARRYYGSYTTPGRADRSRRDQHAIDQLRRRGKSIWAYTYAGPGTPGFRATELLSDPRMFMLWTGLEGIDGMLYGEGTTSYRPRTNPLRKVASGGEFVLLYPGSQSPIPSARLEQIRDGIEDWQILKVVRQKRGAAAVRSILGRTGLFSAGRSGVRLACTVGCPLKGATPFSWPRWSHDASTPRRIEQAHLDALRLASSGP